MKRKAVILISALAIVSLIAINTTKMVAADSEDREYPPFIQKLIEKFNLNQEEVYNFLEEDREERRQEMQAHFEERLNQLVTDGKITETQKQAILSKKEELEQERAQNQEERGEKREEHMEEMKKWAEENGIDLDIFQEIMGNFRGEKGPGFGGRFH